MKFIAVFAALLAAYADVDPTLAIYFAGVSSLLAAWALPGAVIISFGVIFYNLLTTLFPSEQFLVFDLFAGGFLMGGSSEINFWMIGFHFVALIFGFARLGTQRE